MSRRRLVFLWVLVVIAVLDINLLVSLATFGIVLATTLATCIGLIWRWYCDKYFYDLKLQRRNPNNVTLYEEQYNQPRKHLYLDGKDVEIALVIRTRLGIMIDRCTLSFVENDSFWPWRRSAPSFKKANITSVWDIDADIESQKKHHWHYRAFSQPVREHDDKGGIGLTYVPARDMIKDDVIRLRVGIESREKWGGWIQFAGPNRNRHWSYTRARLDMFWSPETTAKEAAIRERFFRRIDQIANQDETKAL
jgi:hypothetical protein